MSSQILHIAETEIPSHVEQPSPMLTTLTVKKVFLNSIRISHATTYAHCFSPCCPTLLSKVEIHLLYVFPEGVYRQQEGLPWAISSLGWTNTTSSAAPHAPALHRFGGLPRLRVNWCFRVTETYLMAILGQRCTAISEGLTRALQSCAATPPPAMRAAR